MGGILPSSHPARYSGVQPVAGFWAVDGIKARNYARQERFRIFCGEKLNPDNARPIFLTGIAGYDAAIPDGLQKWSYTFIHLDHHV
jgi:hypothetical protein